MPLIGLFRPEAEPNGLRIDATSSAYEDHGKALIARRHLCEELRLSGPHPTVLLRAIPRKITRKLGRRRRKSHRTAQGDSKYERGGKVTLTQILLVAIPPYCSGRFQGLPSRWHPVPRRRVAIPPYCSGRFQGYPLQPTDPGPLNCHESPTSQNPALRYWAYGHSGPPILRSTS